MKNILRLVVAAFIVWSAPAFAADNTLIVTPGIGVTTRSKDIGAGLQLPYVGLSDGSGNAIGLIGAPAYIGFGTGVTLPAFASPPAVSLNTTPSLANGNGVVPTQGGNVLSATNGIFANVLQGNAVLSATNGLFSNLLQGNAVLSTSNPIFVTGTGTAGSAATNPITVQGISGGTNLPVILNAETTKVIGEVNQGTSPWVVSNGGTFAVQATLQASATTAIGKVDPNTPANWGIGATGSAVPANAQYIGIISGGNLTGWTGAVTVASGGIASGAIASGAIVDGADVSEGATADAAATAGSTGSVQAKLRLMTSQLATIGTNTGAPPPLGTTGGWTPTALTAITNSSQTVKGSAGQLGFVLCDNNNAAWTYLQLFNATSPSVGTNVGFIPLPPSLSGGMTLSVVGLQFSNSIKVAATTTPTGSTAPATNTINCSFGYN